MSKPLGTKTVLLVDDDPRSIRLMDVVLRNAGYRVLSAGNAEDGLEVLRRERPDLVMADLLMPGADGIGFCRRARQLPGQDTVRIALFTAMASQEIRQEALRSGADDVLVKPFERQALLGRLEQLMALGGSDGATSVSNPAGSATGE